MPISFDTAAAERSDDARALFAALASGTDEPVVLTTLSGVDLCVLGAMSWEALATSWNRLKPEDPASRPARDPDLARRLWERSAQLTSVG